MRVAADAVDDEEGHAELVGDVLGLDHADGLLHLVALGEIGAQAPVHHLDVPRLDLAQIGVVARPADAPLDDLLLAAVHLAGREDEAQQLVRGLGPAVPVVRPVRHLGRHHLQPARPDESLVVVGRVVRAADDDAADPFLERRAVHVVRERDVRVLGPELGVAVVLPCRGVELRRADEAAVDHGVGALEVLAIGVAVGIGEVGDDDARHGFAVTRRRPHVDRHDVPALSQLLEHALGNVARRSCQHHATLGHAYLLMSVGAGCSKWSRCEAAPDGRARGVLLVR
jgi:hypothetical protein